MLTLGRILHVGVFFLCTWLAIQGASAQTNAGSLITNNLLTIDANRSLPLPSQGGNWKVVFNSPDPRNQFPAQVLGLAHSDPQSAIPFIAVRYSHRPRQWTGSVCNVTNASLFMLEFHGSQLSDKTHRCTLLASIDSFKRFRQETKSPLWQPVFMNQMGISDLPDAQFMIGSWRMQEFAGQSLLVEALIRADLLGTSGADLMQTFRINQLNPAHLALGDWLRDAVLTTTETYFNRGQGVLKALDTSDIATSMRARNPVLRGDFASSPVIGTAFGASTPVDIPSPPNSLIPDPLLPERWSSPVNINTDLIRTQERYSTTPTTAFELSGLEPIRAPADGVLLYRGMLGAMDSGFLIDHGHGLYSLLSSAMNWNLRTSPEPGSKIEKGQFLASAVSSGGQSVLTWDVFYSAQPIDSKEGLELVRQLRSQKAINTRLLANIGVVSFTVDGSRDEFSIAIDQRELPRQISFPAMFLFEADLAIVSLQVTTGTFFKTVNKDVIDLSSKGVVTQVIGRKSNKGYGALGSSFVAADLSSTNEVMAILSGSVSPAMASADSSLPVPSAPPVTASLSVPSETMAAAPTPTPDATALNSASAVVNLEAQRLQALADQRAQELTQLRQQLAQAETQRLQDAQRLAEISAAEQKRLSDLLQQQTMAQQRSQELQRPQRIEPVPSNGKRKALVIGNDQYRHVTRLDNARADARAMGQSLQTLGFNVTLALDQTERGLKETLRNFKSSVEGGDEVVVFYAGHGVQIGTTNYLLPVDIAGQNEDQVRDEAIQMQRILDDMQERRTGFLLMIVDACRDNPFKVAGRTLGGRGLAPTSAATGQMVIFSAGTGQQALDKLGADDKEPNGLFTRLFLREMEKPGVSVDRVLRTVRTEVARLARSVGHEQTPALYDQSLGDFFFRP